MIAFNDIALKSMHKLGILGGAFDPIHNGHLALALAALGQLKLDQARLMPVHIPPHRNRPLAANHHRKNMIELALAGQARLALDARELEREAISYTIDTLRSLRREFARSALCLLMGRDAFNKLESWKDYDQLLDYAHLVVAGRPGAAIDNLSAELQGWVTYYRSDDPALLDEAQNGALFFLDLAPLDISSSGFRRGYQANAGVEQWLPAATLRYIRQNNLYPPAT